MILVLLALAAYLVLLWRTAARIDWSPPPRSSPDIPGDPVWFTSWEGTIDGVHLTVERNAKTHGRTARILGVKGDRGYLSVEMTREELESIGIQRVMYELSLSNGADS